LSDNVCNVMLLGGLKGQLPQYHCGPLGEGGCVNAGWKDIARSPGMALESLQLAWSYHKANLSFLEDDQTFVTAEKELDQLPSCQVFHGPSLSLWCVHGNCLFNGLNDDMVSRIPWPYLAWQGNQYPISYSETKLPFFKSWKKCQEWLQPWVWDVAPNGYILWYMDSCRKGHIIKFRPPVLFNCNKRCGFVITPARGK